MLQRLLQVAFFVACSSAAYAQTLFNAPDTVCVRQNFSVTSNVPDSGNTFYWNFCSGYLSNTPTGTSYGAGFGLTGPRAIDIAQDNGNYFAFVANTGTSELFRLDFGASMANTPSVTNLGTIGGSFPTDASSLSLVKDGANWYLYASGGITAASSSIARFDFGTSLANTPTGINLGNPGSVLVQPRGLFIAQDAGNWYGYLVNYANSELIRLDFAGTVANAPVLTDLGNPTQGGGSVTTLLGPTDVAGVLDGGGNWHLFITNQISSTLTQVDLGPSLAGAPAATNLGGFAGALFGPSAITLVADCGMQYAFITNELTNEVSRIDMPDFSGNYTASNLGNIDGTLSGPADITKVVREGNSLFSQVLNGNGTFSRLEFAGCTNASIPSSTLSNPPQLSYDQPGVYNVYFAVNEGTPSAQVECTQITVLAIPKIFLSNDTTICQGDTVNLVAYALSSDTTRWSPAINITDTVGITTDVYPDYSLEYFAHITFPFGCIVDTSITVTVNKNKADAGPDRILDDGASTLLGGPYTTLGPKYTYIWSPAQYLDNAFLPNPTADPATSLTYYLTVTSTDGCSDIDTVNVLVNCNDLNLPNAFVPDGRIGSNRFGLVNRQIVQLNYFRIFDRWGREVFETTDVERAWDGRFNGEPAPAGVYVWEADGFCRSNVRFTRKGNVTLIR